MAALAANLAEYRASAICRLQSFRAGRSEIAVGILSDPCGHGNGCSDSVDLQ